jgi:hypothetical protein
MNNQEESCKWKENIENPRLTCSSKIVHRVIRLTQNQVPYVPDSSRQSTIDNLIFLIICQTIKVYLKLPNEEEASRNSTNDHGEDHHEPSDFYKDLVDDIHKWWSGIGKL